MRGRTVYTAWPLLLLVLPTVHAWTLTWRDKDNTSFIEYGNSDYPCTEIANPAGKVFEYYAESDPCTAYLYGNTNCAGSPMGRALNYLTKPATKFIGSFRVEDRDKVSSSSSSTSAAATTATVTAPVQQTSLAQSDVGRSSSVSGGGIAGIVIGAVAGVALVVGLVVFLRRRRKARAGAVDTVDEGAIAPMSKAAVMAGAGMGDDDPALKKDPDVDGSAHHVVELAGDTTAAELSNSRQVNELSGSAQRSELEAGRVKS